MNRKLKILSFAFIVIFIVYIALNYYPVIFASFDENGYVDGETFTPNNITYDFRTFSLNSSGSENYTAVVAYSGHAQLIDNGGSYTINVFEWDKMNNLRHWAIRSNMTEELKRPGHIINGTKVIVVDFSSYRLYASYIEDNDTNTAIYVATPDENATVEMIKTLKFRG